MGRKILVMFFLTVSSQLIAQDSSLLIQQPEDDLNYSKVLLNNNFDFTLKNTGKKGSFDVKFYNSTEKPVMIKVYDVIGNLIIEEEIGKLGNIEKRYDFSEYKSSLFLVEIGNSKYNLTKSIFAI
ncbi:MAG: hypothetical protein AAF363_09835 [Bacteroidota bacterium]